MIEQYSIFWVDLNPTRGGEMAKTRPCVVVSPTDLNNYLNTVIVVPVTSTIRNYHYRVAITLSGKLGEMTTDQIRTIDKSRLKNKIGKLNIREIKNLRDVFSQLFCE